MLFCASKGVVSSADYRIATLLVQKKFSCFWRGAKSHSETRRMWISIHDCKLFHEPDLKTLEEEPRLRGRGCVRYTQNSLISLF